MRLYKPPTIHSRPSPPMTTKLQNTSTLTVTPARTSFLSPNTSIQQSTSYRQYISRATVFKPIRGRELFVRSIHRVIEQIQTRKQKQQEDLQIFDSFEATMSIFHDLTFVKCMQLKKRILDGNYRTWTIEFSQQGGLQTLLTYLEEVTNKGLSLVDAILVNEVLQCLRAMMNIPELFEHIAVNPQYIDSIAKVLRIPSTEIRMRVFELLTALCVYSTDGYELVLRALQDFQASERSQKVTNKYSHVFVVILEQMKFSVLAKHKWSAITLLNSILSSTDSIEKRLTYRNTLYANGLGSIFDQCRTDDDVDLNFQIENFQENQKIDEEEYLGHFDHNDHQAVYQAIHLQLSPGSTESALFLTAMQLLYTNLTSIKTNKREKLLQNLLQSISNAAENKAERIKIERGVQTDPIKVESPMIFPPPALDVPVIAKQKSNNPPSTPLLINTEASNETSSPIITTCGVPPPPPPPPPPPLGFGLPTAKPTIGSLSVLVDSIPKPKNKLRRLQWKKLPQTILTTSQFWMDVNKKVDPRINFAQLEDSFKINTETSNFALTTKSKATTILPCNRSIAINVFFKKFSFTDARSLIVSIRDVNSNLNGECLRMLLKILPTSDEIQLVHDHSQDQWALPEEFIHQISNVTEYKFRIQSRIVMNEFRETCEDYQRKFQKIRQIIAFLQSNGSIKQLARSLLSIGDFLNYGSYAGNAVGFRLDILNQLQDVRSTESQTLLTLLLENSSENFKFIDDFKPMLAEEIQLKSTKMDYLDWKKKIDENRKFLQNSSDQEIVNQYKSFFEKSSLTIRETLDSLVQQCDQGEKELMNQFGETDINEFNYDSCCAIFRQLIDQVEKAIKEREKRAAANKVLLNSQPLFPSRKPLLISENLNVASEHNLMDSLMSELKQKKFATVPAKRPRIRPALVERNV